MASQDWFDKDFYKVLGVAKDVTPAELKKAYRKLARKYHPDSNPGNPAAEAKFKEISEAHSVIGDPAQRKEYDAVRAMGGGARFTAPRGGGGGQAGGFDDVDLAMMCHPSSRTLSGRTSLASNRVDLEFTGKAAHAAAQPDRGINALDGVIQTFNNVNAMRQQLRPEARVHGIITSGGSAANIIPEYAMAKFSVRALDRRYQQEVLARFIKCAEGAATATGTKLKITVHENSGYENMVPSGPLAERWASHMRALGQSVQTTVDDERMGSTDMGNVSQILPAIHPYIGIAPEGTPGHSTAFRDAAATPEAHAAALFAAKAMALVAIDALADGTLIGQARADFEARRAQGTVKGRR